MSKVVPAAGDQVRVRVNRPGSKETWGEVSVPPGPKKAIMDIDTLEKYMYRGRLTISDNERNRDFYMVRSFLIGDSSFSISAQPPSRKNDFFLNINNPSVISYECVYGTASLFFDDLSFNGNDFILDFDLDMHIRFLGIDYLEALSSAVFEMHVYSIDSKLYQRFAENYIWNNIETSIWRRKTNDVGQNSGTKVNSSLFQMILGVPMMKSGVAMAQIWFG